MANAKGLNTFVQDWSEAFARVCEMVIGIRPHIAWNPDEPPQEAPEDAFWWHHVIASEDAQYPVWIGTAQPAWSKIVEALELADAQQSQDAYSDILSQALMAVAQEIARRKNTKLTVPSAVPSDPQPGDLAYCNIQIQLGETELPALLLGVDPALMASLEEPEQVEQPQTSAVAVSRQDPGLDRLIDLELPVSVVLGRTTLPIREVLKITPGSLIELGHQLGDPVELVVEDAVVARGEVVAVRGNYGVRIRQLISRQDRARLQPQAAELRN